MLPTVQIASERVVMHDDTHKLSLEILSEREKEGEGTYSCTECHFESNTYNHQVCIFQY
jgi:hypothetical protein